MWPTGLSFLILALDNSRLGEPHTRLVPARTFLEHLVWNLLLWLYVLVITFEFPCGWMEVVIAVRVCSRQAGHVELAERLVECQYELTDRLAFYLCGRRPGNTLTVLSASLIILWQAIIIINYWIQLMAAFDDDNIYPFVPRSQECSLYHPSNGRQVRIRIIPFCLKCLSILFLHSHTSPFCNLGLCSYLNRHASLTFLNFSTLHS